MIIVDGAESDSAPDALEGDMRSDQIERLHLTDLVVWPGGDLSHTDENVLAAATELTTGLLVQFSILIPAVVTRDGLAVDYPVVRFTGPRNQLEEVLNRYHGVGPLGGSPFNPDATPPYNVNCSCGDPECMYVGTDPDGFTHKA